MSLTGHLDDPDSPIRRHFEATYPHVEKVRFAATSAPPSTITIDGQPHPLATLARFNPGQPKVLPRPQHAGERNYDWGAAGTAFDYRVRLLLSPQDPAGFVAAAGARNLASRWRQRTPGAAWSELAGAIPDLQTEPSGARERIARPASKTLARLCGLLALYEQLYRAPEEYLADHPLLLAGPDAGLEEHLKLVDERLVNDVAALTALFTERQPDLAGSHHQVISNPIFDRSGDLGGADADLVVDGTLLELKTVKTPVLNKTTVWQILGYLLADTSDRHRIRKVGWYFSRHGYLWRLPVEELLARLHGSVVDLAWARAEFADLLAPPAREHSTSEQTRDSWVNPTIERTVSFFPNKSGRGRWHIAAPRSPAPTSGETRRARSVVPARPRTSSQPQRAPMSASLGRWTTGCAAVACSTPVPAGAS